MAEAMQQAMDEFHQESGVYALEVPSYGGVKRLKIGWSSNLSERFRAHRSLIPDLEILAVWPCSEAWFERMALKWAKENCAQIGPEVFEADDVVDAIESLVAVFAGLGVKAIRSGRVALMHDLDACLEQMEMGSKH